MNKYESALFKLRSYVYKDGYPDINKVNEERLSLLMELCLKEEPYKTIKFKFKDCEGYQCPICKSTVSLINEYGHEIPKYCKFCGQLLDWSNDE